MGPIGNAEIASLSLAGLGTAVTESELVERAKRLLIHHGYIYVRDVPASFDYVVFAGKFGDVTPHHDGSLIWDVRPEAGMEDVYHSGNMQALAPHTEATEHQETPPRYLALWCVKSASGPGGETTLADGYQWLRSLGQADIVALSTHHYEWRSTDGFARKGLSFSARHPILEEVGTTPILRYCSKDVVPVLDGFQERILDSARRFFDQKHIAIKIDRNSLLLWDNWRMIHARNSFNDPERHLKRLLIAHRDEGSINV
ncbi:TauD/TfdA family dioxygenase [Salinispora arenicola]|uniref:Alpha-ketoglutarate-dependent taurine dioxygenase n=1 Tax=Salinispora arenicola TaxID=168697 RepID=A0A542XM60_SALAC|nr:TauD/TfdA family dioxygenase [Salinispora arenicola]TQL36922.1 alpha-ketoglutarate-dependent taurine dioxygenase [Salinispora arenicola]GIM87115.1 hypothetical protein Sar04_38510 [Salinispora arenicola]